MKRILQITIALLFCTGVGWGDALMGDSGLPAAAAFAVGSVETDAPNTTEAFYTASAGDTLRDIGVHAYGNSTAESLAVGLYSVSGTSRTFVFADTIVVTGDPGGVATTGTIAVGLTDGVQYQLVCNEAGPVGGGYVIFRVIDRGASNQVLYSTASRYVSSGSNFSVSGWTGSTARLCFWGHVTSSAAAATPLPLSTVKLGEIGLAPN